MLVAMQPGRECEAGLVASTKPIAGKPSIPRLHGLAKAVLGGLGRLALEAKEFYRAMGTLGRELEEPRRVAGSARGLDSRPPGARSPLGAHHACP